MAGISAISGAEDSISALWRAVFNWSRYFGHTIEEAEDCAQDVSIRAWRTGAAFNSLRAMFGYAKTAARYWSIDRSRVTEHRVTTIPFEHWSGRAGPIEVDDTTPWLLSQCEHVHDRATLIAFATGLTALQQVERWPDLFPTVHDANNARRNLRGRLRRSIARDEDSDAD